ncbi:hypothetical protein [Haloarcula sediminis]|uniref:hypothetical protein n=1 Tax=Haloarcula sediminis TaxID=3111777 RepID=UPI002D769272|nr:hypothetical protein [Haloarcula sp. CK38]
MSRTPMADCDNCNDEVGHLWKHRRPTETMTYRREEWLCAGCHPRVHEGLAPSGA